MPGRKASVLGWVDLALGLSRVFRSLTGGVKATIWQLSQVAFGRGRKWLACIT
ncbi:hypothetical protein CPC08DRAFT_703329 [Agrocybe pediades]|nr:hypothetical protein CPC08DRAFT_703329 [Agrocybe pediades]